MPTIRCVLCGVTSVTATVFRFPTHKVVEDRWKAALGIRVVTPTFGVCSKNFRTEDVAIHKTRVSLVHGAVPLPKSAHKSCSQEPSHDTGGTNQPGPSTPRCDTSTRDTGTSDEASLSKTAPSEKRTAVSKKMVMLPSLTYKRLQRLQRLKKCRSLARTVSFLVDNYRRKQSTETAHHRRKSTPIQPPTADPNQTLHCTPLTDTREQPRTSAAAIDETITSAPKRQKCIPQGGYLVASEVSIHAVPPTIEHELHRVTPENKSSEIGATSKLSPTGAPAQTQPSPASTSAQSRPPLAAAPAQTTPPMLMYQGVTPVVDALDETVRHVTLSTPASRRLGCSKRSRRCSWTLRSSRFHVQSLRSARHRRRLRLPVNVLRKLHKVAESHGTKDLVTAVDVLCDCPAAAAPPDAATIGARVSRAGRLVMKQIIHTDKAPAAIGPYSQAVLVERTLYISGQLGMDAATGQLRDGVEAQTRLAMENMGHILEAAGMTHSNVVKATVLLADMNDFTKVNDVYKTFFTAEFPARAAYQVAALPKGGRVEIEAVAVKTT